MHFSVKSYLRILVLATFFLSCALSGLPQIPPGYYNSAIGKTGEALQIALYDIIKGHTVVSYTPGVWNAFHTTDVKPNGKVWDMYSDIPGGVPPYEYKIDTDQCGSGGGGTEGDCYSREHSFPKSWFNDTPPMNTDLFHIYPTDQYVNGRHSNYPYGAVSSPTWTSQNGSKLGPCSTPGYTGTVFEPRDEYKGDFARSYFYMATRYMNVISTWPPYDPNGAAVLNGTDYPAFKTWYINMLISWHTMDPVSAKEIARNDSIYKIQNNRNPYIDHPEYVMGVWMSGGPKAEPSGHVTGFTAALGSPSYSTVILSWTDATGTVVPDGYLIRGSTVSLSAIPAPVDGTMVTDGGLDKNVASGSQGWTFSGLSPLTTYYFKIFPYTNTGTLIDYKTDGTVPSAYDTTTAGISTLQPGDIAIIEVNSVDTDKISFIALKQLNAGTTINFTDNGFSSPTTPANTNEGFLYYTAPTVIPAGTVVSWHYGMNLTGTGWTQGSPVIQLAVNGDQAFAYQGSWSSGPILIYAVQEGNTAGWLTSGSPTSNTSYMPAALTSNVSAITFPEKNGNYNLITSGTLGALGSLIAHPSNWTRSATLLSTPAWNFMVGTNTHITKNATVLNLTVGANETLTIQQGKTLNVLGTFDINNGN